MVIPQNSHWFAAVVLAVVFAAERPAFSAGEPARELVVQPAKVELRGPRDTVQLIVTGLFPHGDRRDLTPAAVVSGDLLDTTAGGGFVRGKKNGSGSITVTAAGKTVSIPVTVRDLDAASPVSFRRDVTAAFNVGGCNMGACHGTPSGKNGFKLSLRGFDPAADFLQLTREQFGRRTGNLNPRESLIFVKGTGIVPHEGGARWLARGLPAEMVSAWLEQGLKDDAAGLPGVKGIDVLPGNQVFQAPAKSQQLAVHVTYADGTTRDATRLTNFSSSDESIATVSANGLVEFKRPGEVAILSRYLEEMRSTRLTYLEPRAGFQWPNVPENNYIDTHVFAKLKRMTILPSDLSGDGEFVRRAYLDAIGRLPTVAELKAFEDHAGSKKREWLVDQLVARPEFSDYWAMKWADVLRSSRKAIQLKGSAGFQLWLHGHFTKNTPFNEVVKELLTATGNTFSNPPANYYRIAKDPAALAEGTAQLFLGVRMQCAKCHNHPYERWSQDDYYGLAAVFARVKGKPDPMGAAAGKDKNAAAEVIYTTREGEVTQPRTNKPMKPRFPGQGDSDLPKGADRREAFADWLTKPDNPFFAKNVANRVWYHLTGKGIVDPVDDFRDSNPAANDELLEALAKDFTDHKYDLRHLVKSILNSRTYQLSATPNDTNRDDTRYSSHAATKLLGAEVMLDAICDATGVPEKFAGLPLGTRAVQLPDPDVNHPFLKIFGQPARELACECERESEGNLAQALQLINGPTVNEKLKNPSNRLGKLLGAKTPEAEILNEIYLVTLSRKPDPEETKVALAHVAKTDDKRKAWEDVLWAVLNTREFLFRH
jgi:hypothetical protein